FTSNTNALSTTGGTSDNWNSSYTTMRTNSAYWADTRNSVTFTKSISSGENIFSNQVAFSVNNNNAFAPFNAGGPINSYSVVNVNRGNALNTANGVFTAPVTGVYFINFSGITEPGGSGPPHRVYLFKNGGIYPSIQAFSDAAGYNSMSFSLALPLNAGDTLSIYVSLGRIHGNNGSCFSGYLIG
ncbi:MAG: hypothetical protein EBU90_29950, partial [Proteobacteria bacterium]|nr:hypothetical protein [Pseudomonadota bacterium]